ncbi:MAG: SH3 domain-containing protein [Pseudomonadota bacterium]
MASTQKTRLTIATLLSFVLSTFPLLSNDISAAYAQDEESAIDNLIAGAIKGSATGLPLPRFVSLKAKRTNLRVGPSFDHRIEWIYVKPGLPVEVIQEFDVWRRIRDLDGQEGWVHRSLLGAGRHAVVAPWQGDAFFAVHEEPDQQSRKRAELEAGVLAEIRHCNGTWCRVRGERYDGYMKAENLWGVYPDEVIE